MAAPNKNYELKKIAVYILIVFSVTENFFECGNSDLFISNIHLVAHFAASWTLLPGASAPLAPPYASA